MGDCAWSCIQSVRICRTVPRDYDYRDLFHEKSPLPDLFLGTLHVKFYVKTASFRDVLLLSSGIAPSVQVRA